MFLIFWIPLWVCNSLYIFFHTNQWPPPFEGLKLLFLQSFSFYIFTLSLYIIPCTGLSPNSPYNVSLSYFLLLQFSFPIFGWPLSVSHPLLVSRGVLVFYKLFTFLCCCIRLTFMCCWFLQIFQMQGSLFYIVRKLVSRLSRDLNHLKLSNIIIWSQRG